MNLYKLIILVITILLSLLPLNANEKEIINNKLIIPLNNEIKTQTNFNFLNYIKLNQKNTFYKNKNDYLRKARGFLALGITGIIFASFSLPSSIGGTILLWYIAPSFAYTLFIAAPILFFIPFAAIGIPLIITGFIYYRIYKNKKIPDPFIDKNNKIVIFKFNLKKHN